MNKALIALLGAFALVSAQQNGVIEVNVNTLTTTDGVPTANTDQVVAFNYTIGQLGSLPLNWNNSWSVDNSVANQFTLNDGAGDSVVLVPHGANDQSQDLNAVLAQDTDGKDGSAGSIASYIGNSLSQAYQNDNQNAGAANLVVAVPEAGQVVVPEQQLGALVDDFNAQNPSGALAVLDVAEGSVNNNVITQPIILEAAEDIGDQGQDALDNVNVDQLNEVANEAASASNIDSGDALGLVNQVSANAPSAASVAAAPAEAAAEAAESAVNAAENAAAAAGDLLNNASENVDQAVNSVEEAANQAAAAVENPVSLAEEAAFAAGSLAANVSENANNAANRAAETVGVDAQEVAQEAAGLAEEALNVAAANVGAVSENLSQSYDEAAEAAEAAQNAANSAANSAVEAVAGAPAVIAQDVENAALNAANEAADLGNGLVNGASEAVSNAADLAESAGVSAADALNAARDTAAENLDSAQNAVNGVQAAFNAGANSSP